MPLVDRGPCLPEIARVFAFSGPQGIQTGTTARAGKSAGSTAPRKDAQLDLAYRPSTYATQQSMNNFTHIQSLSRE
jgi:hypothetical protein